MGIEPTRDIKIPHTGFEDQEIHQHLSTPKSVCLINYRHYSKTLRTLQAEIPKTKIVKNLIKLSGPAEIDKNANNPKIWLDKSKIR